MAGAAGAEEALCRDCVQSPKKYMLVNMFIFDHCAPAKHPRRSWGVPCPGSGLHGFGGEASYSRHSVAGQPVAQPEWLTRLGRKPWNNLPNDHAHVASTTRIRQQCVKPAPVSWPDWRREPKWSSKPDPDTLTSWMSTLARLLHTPSGTRLGEALPPALPNNPSPTGNR